MKTNRIVFVVLVVLLASFVFFAAQAATAQAVQIPNEVNLFLAGLVFALVTAGFNWLFQYIGLDLRGLATPIAGTLSAYIVAELQGLVNMIPAEYDPYVSLAFKLIVVIIGGVGTLSLIAKARGSKDALL